MKNKLSISVIIRSLLFWFLAILSLPVYNIMLLFIWPLKARIRHRLVMSVTHYYLFLLTHVGGIKYNIQGSENLPDAPAIIAGNHQSAWETVAFNSIFPKIVWIMKKELLAIPLFGWGLRAVSPIAIDRKQGEDALAQVIKQGKDRFAKGFWICAFPEGTRVHPKKRKPFKYGTAKLAISLDVPIVPVAHNAGYCLPKNSFWLYPGVVNIKIGKPIYADNNDPVSFTKKVEAWIIGELDKMGA